MNSQKIPVTILSTMFGLAAFAFSSDANAGGDCGCPKPYCGDGHIDEELGEECDPKYPSPDDGCDKDCQRIPYCGDGYVDYPEHCDGGKGCSDCCEFEPYCGDGTVDKGEECDPGKSESDTCDDKCQRVPVCGDGYVDYPEHCDGGKGCNDCCEFEPYCGDGKVDKELGEQCDYGDKVDGDGCSSKCQIEPCKGKHDADKDTICNKVDKCPDTWIPEKMAKTVSLNPNHWVLMDDDGIFDTKKTNGKGSKKYFTIEDTKGCSCEQIIKELKVGGGHIQHGCSNSVMEDWIKKVSGYKMEGDDGMGMSDLEAPEEIPEEELEELEEIEELDEELEEIPEELEELDLSGTPQANCNVGSGNGSGPVLAFFGLVLAAFSRRRWS